MGRVDSRSGRFGGIGSLPGEVMRICVGGWRSRRSDRLEEVVLCLPCCLIGMAFV